MIKLDRIEFDKLKSIFEKNNGDFEFGGGELNFDPSERYAIKKVFHGKKLRKVLGEYAQLLDFEEGDSFENHFKVEDKPHYFKTPNGSYLTRDFDGIDIVNSGNYDLATKLTSQEVEKSEFDINKLEMCDDEFKW